MTIELLRSSVRPRCIDYVRIPSRDTRLYQKAAVLVNPESQVRTRTPGHLCRILRERPRRFPLLLAHYPRAFSANLAFKLGQNDFVAERASQGLLPT